ncbi:MAG: phosphoribosylformylglycinamidine synthase I [Ilumatobacteraceae bacterium]
MSRPISLVVAAPGTNRDRDVAFALELAGAEPRVALLGELFERPAVLDEARMLVVAGGFSYADSIGAGRLFAFELQRALQDGLGAFVAAGRPVIGICNGFQTLVRAGLLPGPGQRAALGHNASGSFDCRWVTLAPSSQRCVWTKDLRDEIDCPIAHGEGRFVADPTTLADLQANDQIALRYCGATGNPNGSVDDVAGICDPSGVVLGLMPHPENHVLPTQHPGHSRGVAGRLGLRLFEAGVEHAQEL